MGIVHTIWFIIFGLKRRDKDHGGGFPANCGRCDNQVLLHPYGWRTWFHIFWIPLIPFTATRTLMCPICGEAIEVNRSDYSTAKELADLAEKCSDGRISNTEFWNAADAAEFDTFALNNTSQTQNEDELLEEEIQQNIERNKERRGEYDAEN